MLPYPDHIAVRETTAGAQDPVTGLMGPTTTTTVWEAHADVQDDRIKVVHAPSGDQHLVSGAVVWIESPLVMDGQAMVGSGDRLAVSQSTGPGFVERPAEVVEVRLFENALTVRWL